MDAARPRAGDHTSFRTRIQCNAAWDATEGSQVRSRLLTGAHEKPSRQSTPRTTPHRGRSILLSASLLHPARRGGEERYRLKHRSASHSRHVIRQLDQPLGYEIRRAGGSIPQRCSSCQTNRATGCSASDARCEDEERSRERWHFSIWWGPVHPCATL